MTNIKLSEQPKILNGLIEGLAQASGGCSQLIHLHSDPRFMNLRWAIDQARQACISVATYEARKITRVKPV